MQLVSCSTMQLYRQQTTGAAHSHPAAPAGRPPFNGANHVALLRAIERQEAQIPEPIRKALSASCAALLHGLLRRNPVERLTFEEFFAHPFLRSASRSGSSQSGSRHSSQSSSLTSSAEPSPLKPQDRCASMLHFNSQTAMALGCFNTC